MRTFASETKRLIGEYGATAAPVDRLGHVLICVLFESGKIRKRRRGDGVTRWHPRPFYGGSYEPRTP